MRGTTAWTRVAVDFGTGTETVLEVNCLFGGWGSSTGQAWYDDIALEQTTAVSASPRAEVTISPDAPLRAYSPRLFGGFLEHFADQVYGGVFEPGSPLADERGFRRDVIAALQELRLAVVRWPGGCFASGYHWRDGVGPTRTPVRDPVWGVEDPNTFGTDEFVEWCRRVGCEPYICTNAGNGTPEEMRDWVTYCNRPGRPHVRYWSIGNENWGAHEIGARTAAEWGPLVQRSAELMRAADPDIELLAAATTSPDWTLPLLRTAGTHLQHLAIHEYWLPCWAENVTPDYLSCIALSEGPEATIVRVLDILDEAGCRGRIKIAFDEWNLRSWHHPGFPRREVSDPHDAGVAALIKAREKNAIASQYTLADALFSASFLNACLRHADDMAMANIAPIVNTRGPLYVYPGGLVKRATFHVLAMYANLLGERVAAAEIRSDSLANAGSSVAALDALATCDRSHRNWRIALTNRHPTETLSCNVVLGGAPLQGTYRATVLAGDSADAYNDIDRPSRVVPQAGQVAFTEGRVGLPPHSLTIVEISPRDGG